MQKNIYYSLNVFLLMNWEADFAVVCSPFAILLCLDPRIPIKIPSTAEKWMGFLSNVLVRG